jgi:excisionase family DNA binding protein
MGGVSPASNNDVLTINEVAKSLRCRPALIRKEILSGRLPAFRLGYLWRVRRTDFEEFLVKKLKESPTTIRRRRRIGNARGGRPPLDGSPVRRRVSAETMSELQQQERIA